MDSGNQEPPPPINIESPGFLQLTMSPPWITAPNPKSPAYPLHPLQFQPESYPIVNHSLVQQVSNLRLRDLSPPAPSNRLSASFHARQMSNGGDLDLGESEIMDRAPFPWATTRRARIHSLSHLRSEGILKICGEFQCKRCDEIYQIEYDLEAKFHEVQSFLEANMSAMHGRAPSCWISPPLLPCESCDRANCVKPVIPVDMDSINWLFLLLGQVLGCCTLNQLKYFCKHSLNHKTGAKDRVLYLTYIDLCKQLDPDGPLKFSLIS